MKSRKMVTIMLALIMVISIHQIVAHSGYSSATERIHMLQDAHLHLKAAIRENPIMNWLLYILSILGLILTVMMTIDCALNRRDAYWFLILWLLFPVGVVCYVIYFWEYITFPYRVASGELWGGLSASKSRRCPRCQRSGVKLVPFEEGRNIEYICEMCSSELELRREL